MYNDIFGEYGSLKAEITMRMCFCSCRRGVGSSDARGHVVEEQLSASR